MEGQGGRAEARAMSGNASLGDPARPISPAIPNIREVIVGALAISGNWLVANAQTTGVWTITAQKIRYRGEDVWILPLMNGFFPSIALNLPQGRDRDEGARLLMQFLSSLAWWNARVTSSITSPAEICRGL